MTEGWPSACMGVWREKGVGSTGKASVPSDWVWTGREDRKPNSLCPLKNRRKQRGLSSSTCLSARRPGGTQGLGNTGHPLESFLYIFGQHQLWLMVTSTSRRDGTRFEVGRSIALIQVVVSSTCWSLAYAADWRHRGKFLAGMQTETYESNPME